MIYTYNAIECLPKPERQECFEWIIASWKIDKDALISLQNILNEHLPFSEKLFFQLMESINWHFEKMPVFLQNLEILDQFIPFPHHKPLFTTLSFHTFYADLYRNIEEYDVSGSSYSLCNVTLHEKESPWELISALHAQRSFQGAYSLPQHWTTILNTLSPVVQLHAAWLGYHRYEGVDTLLALYPYNDTYTCDEVEHFITHFLEQKPQQETSLFI